MHRNCLALGFLTAVSALSVVHCSSAEDTTGSSEADHTAGEPIHENSLYAWADVAESFSSPLMPQAKMLAADNLVTARLQAWVDRIYDVVRKNVEAKGDTFLAPRPLVRVIDDAALNAWVPSVAAYVGYLEAPGTKPLQVHAETNISLERTTVRAFSDRPVRPINWPTDLGKFEAFWNASKPGCGLKRGADLNGIPHFVAGGDGCVFAADEPIQNGFALTTVARVIPTTKLVTSLSENAVVFVLAHETAHYLRAHASKIYDDKYSFWYARGVHEAKRPVESAEASQLAVQLRNITRGDRINAGPDQKVSPRTAGWLYAYSSGIKRINGCGAVDIGSGSWMTSFFSGHGGSEADRARYLKYEASVLECANASIADGSAKAGAERTLKPLFELEGETLRFDGTLKDLIDSVEVIAAKTDAKERVFREQLAAKGIGWYTSEQEADDLSMELAAMIGISPDQLIEGLLELGDVVESGGGLPYDDVSWSDCKALYANDFKDSAGKPIYVPLGSLDEPHHSTCYRLYNLVRERDTHKYETAAAPTPLSPSWSEVQAAVDAR